MFEAKDVMFIYAVSPVHMGAGTALGAVDNPVQRERHTQHPMLAGSGLKGALRDAWPKGEAAAMPEDVVFGPDPQHAAEHAGALSLGDGQIVLFPVRSLRESYVYATCPTALARLDRMLRLLGKPLYENAPRLAGDDHAVLVQERQTALCGGNHPRLVLETFAFEPAQDAALRTVAARIAGMLPAALGDHFRTKVRQDLVLLSDTRFNYFVRNATVVEPHVRIDDATGTADDGGLYYTENVPPEALFASLVMASQARKKGVTSSGTEVLAAVRDAYANRLVQIGGDATSGRGQVLVSFATMGGA
jgi:CRISPR-associated protein Cmr4